MLSKDQWEQDVERVKEDFAAERLTFEEAADALVKLGFNPNEAAGLIMLEAL